MESQTKQMKVVYTVVERGPGKSYWTRVGVGFTNKDGSLNLRLDAIPVNGTLQVRDWEAQTDERGSQREDSFANGSNGSNGSNSRNGGTRRGPQHDTLT